MSSVCPSVNQKTAGCSAGNWSFLDDSNPMLRHPRIHHVLPPVFGDASTDKRSDTQECFYGQATYKHRPPAGCCSTHARVYFWELTRVYSD